MNRKVIKIGSSLGVTIPRNEVKDLNIAQGDEINVAFTPSQLKPSKHDIEIFTLTQKLIKRHKIALKNLANK